jgi:hypothetical protein
MSSPNETSPPDSTPDLRVDLPELPDLIVAKSGKGPVMTTIEEFCKVGPGRSSSHTIGPMRIAYDFYPRCTKHHFGMTCDPVAGYVQVPCIERCAYGRTSVWSA